MQSYILIMFAGLVRLSLWFLAACTINVLQTKQDQEFKIREICHNNESQEITAVAIIKATNPFKLHAAYMIQINNVVHLIKNVVHLIANCIIIQKIYETKNENWVLPTVVGAAVRWSSYSLPLIKWSMFMNMVEGLLHQKKNVGGIC